MKIICVGRNYLAHAAELNNPKPSSPIIFLKPETALLRPNEDFYHPSFSKDIHFEAEIVVKINKEGKNVSEKFASKYYSEIGVGIDFTARDVQNELKAKGLPWELSKAFNGSAAVSNFVSASEFENIQNINFSLNQNNVEKQNGNTKDMLFSIDYIISFVSQYFTLKKGDLIYTGTPVGVEKIAIGDVLDLFIEGQKLLTVNVK